MMYSCIASKFWSTRQNVLSRDTEAQLRQKPTFIDESAEYKLSAANAEQQSKKKNRTA